MAYEQNPYAIKITLVADSSLSASSQFLFVKTGAAITKTTSAVAVSGATDRPIGVLQNQPVVRSSGYSEAEVTVSGVTKVVAGGNISIGSILTTNASGQAVVAVPGTDTTKFILGTALTAGVSGDYVTAVINCGSASRAA